MSYSFHVKAASKDEARELAAAKLAQIVESQPIHARDLPAVSANIDAVLGLLADDPTKDISLTVNGSVAWADEEAEHLTQVSVCCGAGHVAKEN